MFPFAQTPTHEDSDHMEPTSSALSTSTTSTWPPDRPTEDSTTTEKSVGFETTREYTKKKKSKQEKNLFCKIFGTCLHRFIYSIGWEDAEIDHEMNWYVNLCSEQNEIHSTLPKSYSLGLMTYVPLRICLTYEGENAIECNKTGTVYRPWTWAIVRLMRV